MDQIKSVGDVAYWMRNTDPRIYDQFVKILEREVLQVTVAVTEAPPSEILVFQGRAQYARKIYQMFTDIRNPRP